MNPDSGRVYRGTDEIEKALLRGEPLVNVSEQVADAVELGMDVLSHAQLAAMNRKERRKYLSEVRRHARRAARRRYG